MREESRELGADNYRESAKRRANTGTFRAQTITFLGRSESRQHEESGP